MSLEGLVSDDLNLPGVRTLRHVASNGQHTFHAEGVNPQPVTCCLEGDMHARFDNGHKPQVFLDSLRENQPSVIHYERQRWKPCPYCKGTPYERLDWKEPKTGMTVRLADWIFEKCKRLAFSTVAADLGIDPKTAAAVFRKRALPAVDAIRRQTPRVLGMDEKYIWRKFRAVFGDVEKRTLLWMLPNRDNDTLTEFFEEMPDKDRVEVVTIDMYWPYRTILRKHFPNAVLVVDKFHIVRYAQMAISMGRAALRKAGQEDGDRLQLKRSRHTLHKRRENWKEHDVNVFRAIERQWPEMAELYEWKEAALMLFDWPHDEAGARQAYATWKANLPAKFRPFFRRFTNNMQDSRWGKEIFAYFSHRYTNAYIERLNGMIDDANNVGRGYKDSETLFLKMMLTQGVPRTPKKRVQRAREILDGLILPGARGSIFGLGELLHLPYALWRSWRASRDRGGDHGVPLATLSEGFRDPSNW